MGNRQYTPYNKDTYEPQTVTICQDHPLKNQFYNSVRFGDIEQTKLFLQDPTLEPNSHAITLACECGQAEILKLLLADPRFDPKNVYDAPGYAAANGHYDVMVVLLEDGRSDEDYNYNFPFRAACANGYYDIAKLLLTSEYVKPHDAGNYALNNASRNGHARIVEMLLKECPTVNPMSSDYCEPLIEAMRNNRVEVVKILLSDSRVDLTMIRGFKTAEVETLMKVKNILLSRSEIVDNEIINSEIDDIIIKIQI